MKQKEVPIDSENQDSAVEDTLDSPNPESENADKAETKSESTTESSASSSDESLVEQLAAAVQKADENYSLYLRAVADLENYRKRTIREKDELRRFGAASFFEDLMPALDNLALGLVSAEDHPEAKSIADGFRMIVTQFQSVFESNGFKELNPIGENFDPNQHECISQQPNDEIEEGKILSVVRKGYFLHDRLLRPAAVIVSSGTADKQAEEE